MEGKIQKEGEEKTKGVKCSKERRRMCEEPRRERNSEEGREGERERENMNLRMPG